MSWDDAFGIAIVLVFVFLFCIAGIYILYSLIGFVGLALIGLCSLVIIGLTCLVHYLGNK